MLLSQKYFFFYSRTVTKLHRVLHSGHTSFFFCNCFAFRVGSAAFRCFSGQQATGRRQVGGRHFRFVSYGQFLSSRFLPSTTIWNVSLAVRSTLDLRPIGLSVTTSMGRIFFLAESPHATAAEKKNISREIHRRAPCPRNFVFFTRNTRKNGKNLSLPSWDTVTPGHFFQLMLHQQKRAYGRVGGPSTNLEPAPLLTRSVFAIS